MPTGRSNSPVGCGCTSAAIARWPGATGDRLVTFTVHPSEHFRRWTIPEAFQYWWFDRWMKPKRRTVN
jgi:hypothetical protein